MYYARGGRVAQFESAEAVFPSALHFSGEGDLFPVHIRYEDDDVDAFAKGGLAHETMAVKDAGRHGDTEIVHMNKEELEELKQMWGEPTINPQTGQPEYFLKKLWKGVKKVIKPIAPLLPMAAMFIPGIGPLAAAGIGALSGGVTGGLKGAIAGGLTGGLTGGANPLAGKLVSGVAPGLSQRAASAIGSGLVGAGTSALTGGNPLTGGLMSGGLNYLANPTASRVDANRAANFGQDIEAGLQNTADTSLAVTPELTGGSYAPTNTPSSGGGIGGWLQKQSLLKGIPNYVPAGAAAVLAASALSKKKGSGLETPEQFLGKDYGGMMATPASSPLGTSLGVPRQRNVRPMEDYYNAGFMPQFRYFGDGYAHGGDVAPGHGSRSFAVNGPGDGRSDDIPAMLSDGEYVVDAETVALLGNGSPKAGAKKLDEFRVKVRKHKGRKLAQGKFSAKAKTPEVYMMGGRA